MPPNQSPSDVPSPTAADEEIIDPSIPAGSTQQITIRRHPFGIVALYLQAIFGVGLALGLIFFLVPGLVTADNKAPIMHSLSLVSVGIIALTVLFLLLATFIYNQNRWIVTDDSITQFTQIGLFRRQNSQLSMANIEDVTAEQVGILAELFGFGTLKCETAGEHSNFHFLYCPRPSKYAKIILDARERFINEEPTAAKRANELLNMPNA